MACEAKRFSQRVFAGDYRGRPEYQEELRKRNITVQPKRGWGWHNPDLEVTDALPTTASSQRATAKWSAALQTSTAMPTTTPRATATTSQSLRTTPAKPAISSSTSDGLKDAEETDTTGPLPTTSRLESTTTHPCDGTVSVARLVVYYGSAAIVLLSVIVIVVAIIWGAMRYRRLRCSYYLVNDRNFRFGEDIEFRDRRAPRYRMISSAVEPLAEDETVAEVHHDADNSAVTDPISFSSAPERRSIPTVATAGEEMVGTNEAHIDLRPTEQFAENSQASHIDPLDRRETVEYANPPYADDSATPANTSESSEHIHPIAETGRERSDVSEVVPCNDANGTPFWTWLFHALVAFRLFRQLQFGFNIPERK